MLFTSPVPSSFFLPCMGRTDILESRRTIRCPPLPDSNVQPSFVSHRLELLARHQETIQQMCG
jgi:hypothetical protein